MKSLCSSGSYQHILSIGMEWSWNCLEPSVSPRGRRGRTRASSGADPGRFCFDALNTRLNVCLNMFKCLFECMFQYHYRSSCMISYDFTFQAFYPMTAMTATKSEALRRSRCRCADGSTRRARSLWCRSSAPCRRLSGSQLRPQHAVAFSQVQPASFPETRLGRKWITGSVYKSRTPWMSTIILRNWWNWQIETWP